MSTTNGTSTNDTLTGTQGEDTIFGNGGADNISGLGANDTIYGDDGSTTLSTATLDPVNTDNIDDSSGTETNNIHATELVTLANGKLIMITSERLTNDDGISTYQIDNDPSSSTYGQVIGTNPNNSGHDDVSAKISSIGDNSGGHLDGYDNIADLAAVTLSNGNTYVYTADNSGGAAEGAIGIAQIDGNGNLTNLGHISNDYTHDMKELTIAEVGGQQFLIGLNATSSTDELTVHKINDDGTLTETDVQFDGTGTGENFLNGSDTFGDATLLESFTNSNGDTFVIAGGADDGVSLWTLDGNGDLTFENARGDNQAGAGETDPQGNSLARDVIQPDNTGLEDPHAATFAEIDGETYMFVGGNADNIDVFRIDPDGSNDGTFDLTLVGQTPDVTIKDISSMAFLPDGNGSGSLVVGGEQQGLTFFEPTVLPSGELLLTKSGFVDDDGEPGAELLDSEDIDVEGGILVSASDNDHGVAIVTTGLGDGVAFNDAPGGNDSIDGGAGNDLIFGEEGDDTIDGGIGEDTIYGDLEGGLNGGSNSPASLSVTINSQAGQANGSLLAEVTDVNGDVEIITLTSNYDHNVGETFTLPLDNGDSVRLGITNGNSTIWSTSNSAQAANVSGDSAQIGFEDDGNGDNDFDDVVITANVTGPASVDLPGVEEIGDGFNPTAGSFGDDVLLGGADDDVIYGDNGVTGIGADQSVRESLNWEGVTDAQVDGTFSQDTGENTVTMVRLANDIGGTVDVNTDQSKEINTDNIDSGGALVDSNSSMRMIAANNGGSNVRFEFEKPVENVSFNIADIDGADEVKLRAFDADGNPIEVVLTPVGNGVIVTDTDGVPGADTATDPGANWQPTDTAGTVTVTVPGPVASLELSHDSTSNLGVYVSDMYFDTPLGVDQADGGDDILTGGDGADTLFGEGGDDVFVVSNAADANGDVVYGGDGPDDTSDNDVLDLRGAGQVVIDDIADATDDGATTGTVTFQDGSTLEFSQIEEILTDPASNGAVDGLNNGEVMDPGYTDVEGDQIDGTDGDNDTIFGNGGDDTIDSGEGDDTVDGGDGDDVFVIDDSGSGIDNDSIIGGEGDEDGLGDVIDASDIVDDLTVTFTAPETGEITDGVDTTTFEEIEGVATGSGDDTITGSDGDELISSGGGDDTIVGGDGDDTIDGGGDNDVIDGGDGSDSIEGGDGNDSITSSDPNNDLMPDKGYPGVTLGEEGTPGAENERDFVDGGAGDDTISTGDDRDTIVGGTGDDVIDGGIDDDIIDGDDTTNPTEGGADRIVGGEGNDLIDGGVGNDTIYAGNDPVLGLDILDIEDDGSNPFGPDLRPDNGLDTVSGGEGDDLIFGADDDDVLLGDEGNDTIDGGIDDDTIDGGDGDDRIIGGQGVDDMSGGFGSDRFIVDQLGDGTDDVIVGGEDADGKDIDVLDLAGSDVDNIAYTGGDPASESGVVTFADGGTLTFSEIETVIPCFTPGTLIATPKGERLVEELQPGDRIITRDNGIQEIAWVGHKKMTGQDLMQRPNLKPVLVKAGSLAPGLPERDMMLSPNHKLLMTGSRTELYFEEREVFAAAKHLIGMPGIEQVDVHETTYIHFMFEQHEIVLSDGAWTESFHPGEYSINAIDQEARAEILALFPELATEAGREAYQLARMGLKKHEAKLLIA